METSRSLLMAGAGLQTKGEDHGVIAFGVGDLDHRVLKFPTRDNGVGQFMQWLRP